MSGEFNEEEYAEEFQREVNALMREMSRAYTYNALLRLQTTLGGTENLGLYNCLCMADVRIRRLTREIQELGGYKDENQRTDS